MSLELVRTLGRLDGVVSFRAELCDAGLDVLASCRRMCERSDVGGGMSSSARMCGSAVGVKQQREALQLCSWVYLCVAVCAVYADGGVFPPGSDPASTRPTVLHGRLGLRQT